MPSFVQTKVDPSRLSTISGNINENIRQVENAMKKVRQTLTEGAGSSLKATWTGPASAKFYSQVSADSEIFDSMLQVLQTLNEQLKEAAAIFDSADNKALELVRQLKIG